MTTFVADSIDISVAARPPYRHAASDPPAALAHLRSVRVWCVWKHELKDRRWTKPPCSWRDGRKASITDPRNWGTFDEALASMARYRLDGIGLVLEAAGYSGADFDHCITDSGSYLPVAAEAISFGETYGEVSPSGSGIHMLIEGAAGITIKRDDIGVELYERGRYFTVTGDQINDLPARIAPAPKLIEYLTRLDAETPKPGKESNSAKATRLNSHTKPVGSDFFANVKSAAFDNLDAWVPTLHPSARKQATGAWRVKSKNMGRAREEDLSYHPDGIQDFGDECTLTPIDAVQKYGTASDTVDAAMWLCHQLGVEPAALGWRGGAAKAKSDNDPRAPLGGDAEAIDKAIDDADVIAEMVAEICNGVDIDPIPPREWLLGRTFCKEFVGGLAGPGGTGKTALRTAQLMSVAVDRPLTGETVYRRAKVFAICLEDSRNEYRRRQRACLLYHGINHADTVGYFYWITVTERAGKIAAIGPDGKVMPGTLAGVIEAAIVKLGIELVHFDPFVKAHGLPENDNRLIDDVMSILSSISARHNVSLDSTYHMPKGPSDPGNADKFRGGGAQKDALRLAKTVTPMSPEEATRFGIPEQKRRFYIRYDDAKINLSPYQHTSWFRLVSVPLDNGNEIYPDGDHVQTVEAWQPPDAWADMNTDLTNRILDAIDKGMPNGERYSAANAARERAVWRVVADMAGKEEGPAKEIVKGWLKSRLLAEQDYKSPTKRETLKGLRVDNSKRPAPALWVPE